MAYGYSRRRSYNSGSAYRKGKRAGTRAWARAAKALRDESKLIKGSAESIGMYGADWANATEKQKVIRRISRYRGAGDYSLGYGANAGLASAMRSGGRALGGLIGMPSLGHSLGGHASKFIGWGEYGPTSTNAIIDGSGGSNQQQIAVNADESNLSGDVIIAHTEFVQNVTVNALVAGTTGFNIQSFAINPALSSLFPFLSQLAQNFTLYEFAGLMIQYKPSSGEFGSAGSNSLGKVIFATNYDPDASPFTSSQQMENYDYANSTKPSCGMIHGVETKPTARATLQLYTRTGTSTKDKVFTDIGLFQLATEGIYANAAGNQVIGELWVTYKVKLSRKNLQQSIGTTIEYMSGNWIYNAAGNTFNQSSVTDASNASVNSLLTPYQSFWNVTAPLPQNGGLQWINASAYRFSFPQNIVQGTYILTFSISKSIPAVCTVTFGTPVGCTIRSGGSTFLTPPVAGSATNAVTISQCAINVNAPGSLIANMQINLVTTGALNNDVVILNITQAAPNTSLT